VVRAWGQSLEASEPDTFGHSERVAQYAVAVGRVLGLGERDETSLLFGAYLHDVGKLKVPHEILNKPTSLSPEELAVARMHPVWGVELLAGVEFPWDIKPIIRWHHERHDGTGYPDRLRGSDIPQAAQIVGIVELYDALTTGWHHQPALPKGQAIERILSCRSWWSAQVYEAFVEAAKSWSEPETGG
jgi:putative nucleotidyltransferase with HDIG domain